MRLISTIGSGRSLLLNRGAGMSGKRQDLGGMGGKSRGAKSLRPDLRTSNFEEGETSY